jgi:hypothetical protein
VVNDWPRSMPIQRHGTVSLPREHCSALASKEGSEQEFDGRPVLWAFRRFYSIFDLCCSRFREGGVQSRSSDGNRDIDAVVSDSF